MRLTRGSDAASSAAIGLAVSAALMAGAFLMANLMVDKPETIDSRTSSYEAQAQSALEVMVRDAGLTSTGLNWASDADHMTRFGLSIPGEPNFIDYTKIKALRNGTFNATANGAPDYPEVRVNLGIKEGDFHLRTYPVLPSLADPRWTKEQTGRVAYFAHYTGGTAPVSLSTSTSKDANRLNVSVEIRNIGISPAVYTIAIGLGPKYSTSDVVAEQRHTRLLMPGEEQTVWAKFWALPSWDASINATHVQVTDPYGKVAVDGSGNPVGEAWYSVTPPTGSTYSVNYLMSAGTMYYVSPDKVVFTADYYDGTGGHKSGVKPWARFVLLGPSGTEIVNTTTQLGDKKNAHYTYSCTTCTTVGNYTGVLYAMNGSTSTDYTRKLVDVVHVSAAKMFTEKATIGPLALTEVGILQTLVTNFNPTRYDAATNPGGDLFGDDSNGPNEIADVLSRYSTLIIGSEVTQTALNSATTKYAISDWVQAGGNLIVLGTVDSQSNWLQPIYHAMQVNANGGIGAPDPTHPILVSPDRLDYTRYMDRGRAWNIRNDQPFTHVLTRGSGANSVDDTLTVNNPGTLGNGTVVLTSYMPASLTDPQDNVEARKFLHNLLSQSYTMLFLDYGPQIPGDVPVGSAQRLVAVPHPNVPGAVVEVKLVMYVFG